MGGAIWEDQSDRSGILICWPACYIEWLATAAGTWLLLQMVIALNRKSEMEEEGYSRLALRLQALFSTEIQLHLSTRFMSVRDSSMGKAGSIHPRSYSFASFISVLIRYESYHLTVNWIRMAWLPGKYSPAHERQEKEKKGTLADTKSITTTATITKPVAR